MANKRISPKEDPLVHTVIHYPQSQRNQIDLYCKKVGKSIAAVHREWATFHLDSPEAETNALKKERLELEARIKLIDARLVDREAAYRREEAAHQKRYDIIETIATKSLERLVYTDKGLRWLPEDMEILKKRIKTANQALNGSEDHLQEDEVINRINQMFEAELAKKVKVKS